MMAFIQARMSSQRLPGKVLADVGGKPMLGYLAERLRNCREIDGFAVLTSDQPEDGQVADWCRAEGVQIYRGSLDNVLGRFIAAASELRQEACVRISGDSPLLDPKIVDRAVSLFRQIMPDLVTNVFPRSFPKGQSVEVVSCSALQRAAAEATVEDCEHVTRFIYRHPDRFRIENFSCPQNLGELQMSVDTREDFEAFRQVVSRMALPQASYDLDGLLRLYGYED